MRILSCPLPRKRKRKRKRTRKLCCSRSSRKSLASSADSNDGKVCSSSHLSPVEVTSCQPVQSSCDSDNMSSYESSQGSETKWDGGHDFLLESIVTEKLKDQAVLPDWPDVFKTFREHTESNFSVKKIVGKLKQRALKNNRFFNTVNGSCNQNDFLDALVARERLEIKMVEQNERMAAMSEKMALKVSDKNKARESAKIKASNNSPLCRYGMIVDHDTATTSEVVWDEAQCLKDAEEIIPYLGPEVTSEMFERFRTIGARKAYMILPKDTRRCWINKFTAKAKAAKAKSME